MRFLFRLPVMLAGVAGSMSAVRKDGVEAAGPRINPHLPMPEPNQKHFQAGLRQRALHVVLSETKPSTALEIQAKAAAKRARKANRK